MFDIIVDELCEIWDDLSYIMDCCCKKKSLTWVGVQYNDYPWIGVQGGTQYDYKVMIIRLH